MDAEELLSPQVLIVVGKGGVGKTTVSATMAHLAARAGRKVLIVEVEGKGSLASVFRSPPLAYKEQKVADGVWARALNAEDALVDYFHDHNMGRLSRRLAKSNVIDYVATAIPGLKDIIVLGKVKAIANSGEYDTIVVDSPAAGHAVVFLTGGRGILDAVRVGPIREQASEVLGLLEDPGRCRVPLVTLAEETPVNETLETATRLTDKLAVRLGPVLVNQWITPGVEPAPAPSDVGRLAADAGVTMDEATARSLASAARFRAARRLVQEEQYARLEEAGPGELFRLPFCFSASFGPDELALLTDSLAAQLSAVSV